MNALPVRLTIDDAWQQWHDGKDGKADGQEVHRNRNQRRVLCDCSRATSAGGAVLIPELFSENISKDY